ncbi:exodeoxyribonuclease V subunit gamma [Thauera aromatica]|uniref:Exodeoxyribonuclease V gamma chain n=1 Tax=Thauera aromatica K172 TaxID=44139 RepID=A0A2R4BQB0_THAAR|nr:exodeoxyribonuclease V subunit gamma [Thauera aromatica]AVR89460.1 Exodeoxyribonuclease V gamma chain [Thauera aromatica K172]MCK2095268.1 exodeoxyribonuclease V subunit gamma [Thauera aromatica]
MTDTDLSPGLILIHGNQAESLHDLLVTWVKRHPLAPLETEVVLVQKAASRSGSSSRSPPMRRGEDAMR